jgi:hypothetical protein
MPLFSGIVFHEGGGAGWSSVYYIDASALPAAQTKLNAIAVAECGIMADAVTIPACRLSDVQIRGDGFLFVPLTAQGQLVTGAGKLIDFDLAARFEFWDASFTHRVNHFIHGLRAADVDNDANKRQILATSYTVLAAITTYINAVTANSVNWQHRSLPPVTAPLTTGAFSTFVSTRRVGRPFNQYRGRRRVA